MSAYAVSSRGLAAHKVPQGVLATIMEMLYSNSENGIAKLDFSDFAGMYQDRARTIPYTAVEQPLGSFTGLNGVTATAPADVNRGVVSARVNLLYKTYTFDFFSATGVSPGTPAGGVIEITENSSNALHAFQYFIDVDASRKRLQIYAKCGVGNRNLQIQLNNGLNRGYATFDLVNGVVLSNTTSGSGLATSGISADSDGFWKCWVECTTDSGTYRTHWFGPALGNLATYQGDGVSSIVIRNPSYVSASEVNLPYQRVNTYTDYDTAGFPHYLKFDGTNTAYVTPSIDFTGTDKMTVWAGVTNFGTSTSILSELSAVFASNPGSWGMTGYEGGQFAAFARAASAGNRNFTSPDIVGKPRVQTAMFNLGSTIVNEQVQLRNLSLIAPGSGGGALVGGGNFGNYPLYIGARAGTSIFFNGHLYNLIVRGAQSSLSQIEVVETLIRQKMRLP